MFAVESADGTQLVATVSRGGVLVLDELVTRNVKQLVSATVNGVETEVEVEVSQTAPEPTKYSYDFIAASSLAWRAARRIVEISADPTPDTDLFSYTENAPQKIGGAWRITFATTPREPDRNGAYVAIDTAAELARQAYITPGAGQAMTYQRKLEEARAYLADPQGGPFPLLEVSIGADGADLAAVAATVVAANAAWTAIGAAIEGVRLHGKRRAEWGADAAAVRTVRQLSVNALGAIAASGGVGVAAIVADVMAAMAQAAPEPQQ